MGKAEINDQQSKKKKKQRKTSHSFKKKKLVMRKSEVGGVFSPIKVFFPAGMEKKYLFWIKKKQRYLFWFCFFEVISGGLFFGCGWV